MVLMSLSALGCVTDLEFCALAVFADFLLCMVLQCAKPRARTKFHLVLATMRNRLISRNGLRYCYSYWNAGIAMTLKMEK